MTIPYDSGLTERLTTERLRTNRNLVASGTRRAPQTGIEVFLLFFVPA